MRAVDVCLSPHMTAWDSCLNKGSRTCFVPRAYQSFFVVGNTKVNISSMVWIILNSQIMTQYTNIKKIAELPSVCGGEGRVLTEPADEDMVLQCPSGPRRLRLCHWVCAHPRREQDVALI